MRSNVTALSRLGAEGLRVREDCDAVIATIESSVRTTWLPVELDVALSNRVVHRCGEKRFAAWCRNAIAESAKGPLLEPLMSGLTRLGFGPRHAVRRLPGGWNLIYRNCGTLRIDREWDGGAVIVIDDVPELVRDHHYATGIGAAFEGVALLIGARSARSDLTERGQALHFELTWTTNADAAP